MNTRNLLVAWLFLASTWSIARAETPADFQKQLELYFAAAPADRATVELDENRFAALTAEERELVRQMAWRAYREGWERKAIEPEIVARAIKVGEYTMPFTIEERGKRPAGGWPVLIAMHGGGGAPKALNDSQWHHMQHYYPVSDCLYIAPRAPTDEWNGFYTDYFYPLLDRLIAGVNATSPTNPDRIYMIGYSHGGYGAFACGPKMPDRFAAVHASASAPTDGETVAEPLANLRFTFMVGERDNMYGRVDRTQAFAKQLEALRADHADHYDCQYTLVRGAGHGGLPDLEKPAEMLGYSRNSDPAWLNWLQSDGVIRTHYWLTIDQPAKGQHVVASRDGNAINIDAQGKGKLTVGLRSPAIDFTQPITVTLNGSEVWKQKVTPSLRTLVETLAARGDRPFAYEAQLEFDRER